MTYTWIEEIEPKEGKAWGVSWGIDAPWAHPIWSQYVLHLYDLTTPLEKPPILYNSKVTHEFLIYAVDPNTPLIRDEPFSKQDYKLLEPPNHGYQFKSMSNSFAQMRLQNIVTGIQFQQINPDTDYTALWDDLFSDAFTLKK